MITEAQFTAILEEIRNVPYITVHLYKPTRRVVRYIRSYGLDLPGIMTIAYEVGSDPYIQYSDEEIGAPLTVRWGHGVTLRHSLNILYARILAMRKPQHVETSNGSNLDPTQQCGIMSTLPALWEHMTVGLWEDGTARQTTTIGIAVSDGRFLVTARDRATTRVCFSSGRTLQDALEAMDSQLADPECPWRKDHFAAAQKRK